VGLSLKEISVITTVSDNPVIAYVCSGASISDSAEESPYIQRSRLKQLTLRGLGMVTSSSRNECPFGMYIVSEKPHHSINSAPPIQVDKEATRFSGCDDYPGAWPLLNGPRE